MYPNGELAELAERKALLQARIEVRRWECAAAAFELSRPIAALDRGIEFWHRIAPFAKLLAIPAGIMLTRFLGKRRRAGGPAAKRGKIAATIAAIPMILRGVKLFGQMRAVHAARKAARSSPPPHPAPASAP
jgi:hypothetical protein